MSKHKCWTAQFAKEVSEQQQSATSPLRNGHVVYDVWLMTGLLNKRRIASEATLREAHAIITSEHRKAYVYILKWTPARSVPQEVTTSHPQGRFGATQGQHRTPEPAPTCKYIWGCICNRVHTNDMRDQVRAILRG